MANGTIAFDTLTTSDSKKTSTEKSVDTSYIYNGVTKAWLQMNGKSVSIAVGDNLNHSSITDSGTGLYDPVFTSPMANAVYCSTGAAGELVDNGGNRMVGLRARATTGQHLRGFYDGNSASDLDDLNLAVHGDLA
tara:strand:+ start:123 stop:527 length:405 start_codon:yes stop_codon:yes gene_type:complete